MAKKKTALVFANAEAYAAKIQKRIDEHVSVWVRRYGKWHLVASVDAVGTSVMVNCEDEDAVPLTKLLVDGMGDEIRPDEEKKPVEQP